MIDGVCQLCGGIQDKKAPMSLMRDSDVLSEEDSFLTGCLCFIRLEQLETEVVAFEERFLKRLKADFPGRSREQVIAEVQRAGRNSPLRAAIMIKLGILQRAKERLKVLHEKRKADMKLEERVAIDRKEGFKGEELGLSGWLNSFQPTEQLSPQESSRPKVSSRPK